MKRLLTILLFVLAVPLFAQPTKQWSQGNPSNEEQFALEVINRVRRDPVAAANFFIGQEASKPVLKSAIGTNTYRPDGSPVLSPEDSLRASVKLQLDGYNSSVSAGRTPAPKPPLAFYPLFSEQARAQNLATGTAVTFPAFDAADFFNTVGANLPAKVTPPKVVQQFGFNGITAPAISGTNATGGTASLKPGFAPGGGPQNFSRGQLLYVANYYDPLISLREAFVIGSANLALFLDDSFVADTNSSGVTTLRGKTRMIGLSLGDARTSSPGQGARVLSGFATDNEGFQSSDLPFGADTVFITGVVYQDNDKDGDYTPGEGLAGVRITPNKGEWFAITSASGGFSIPVSKNSGALTVSASGGPAGSALNTSNVVTIGGDSVKLDFVRQNTAKPAQVTVEDSDGVNQFINLSTRGVAEAGDTALIGGFVISGVGKKTVLIRGVANSLTGFGLSGILRKPLLTLFDSNSQPIKAARTQDTFTFGFVNGQSVVIVKPELAAVFKQVGAFDYLTTNAPATDLNGAAMRFAGESDGTRPAGDSAMVVQLDPGLYSVSITPDGDTSVGQNTTAPATSGLVLLEIYDVTPGSGSRFINLSTRGKIETGARQMIVGFVISGTGHRRLLVRGIGPALKGFGLPGALDDSQVDLFDSSSQPLLSNDDWGIAAWTDQTVNVSAAVGAFALSDTSRDGVILTRVTPGLYSAGVRSANGQEGIGLAEIYEN